MSSQVEVEGLWSNSRMHWLGTGSTKALSERNHALGFVPNAESHPRVSKQQSFSPKTNQRKSGTCVEKQPVVALNAIPHGRVPQQPVTRCLCVTGGAGFIGANFINYWASKYPHDKIVNLDNLDVVANPKNIEDPHNCNYYFVRGDILDQNLLVRTFENHVVTHVVHFAAASNVDISFESPVTCTQVNVLGTHALLEAVRSYTKLRLLVYISTDEVYGEAVQGSMQEKTCYSPTNPYAASKAAAECLVMSYGKSFKVPFVITRGNNVYGRYQYPRNVIPRFTMNLLARQKMPVHGDGSHIRNFVHVLDKCRAIDLILRSGLVGSIYNIGDANEVSVNELCSILVQLVLRDSASNASDWIETVADRPYNDCRYSVDYTKLKQLGWMPEVQFPKGLADTVEWYSKNQKHWKQFPLKGSADIKNK